MVEITDEDLPLSTASPAGAWPARFDDYAGILRTIGGTKPENRPKAVFFDIFLDREPTTEDPADQLCGVIGDYAEAGVPLFFASLAQSRQRGGLLSLSDCPTRPMTASADWSSDEGQMGLFGRSSYGSEAIFTAAPALYMASLSKRGALEFEAEASRAPSMTVVFGSKAPVLDPACPDFDATSFRARLERSAELYVQSVMLNDEARRASLRQQPCPFHARLPVRSLVKARGRLAELTANEFTSDRFVLIGANVLGIPDYFSSPVHGQLPGVYLHAMALDNLLVLGTDYIRPAPELELWKRYGLESWTISANDLLEAGVLLVLASAMLFMTRYDPGTAPVLLSWGRALLLRFGLSAVMLLIIGTIIISTRAFLHWQPLNWGGVFLTGLTMIFPWRYRYEETNG